MPCISSNYRQSMLKKRKKLKKKKEFESTGSLSASGCPYLFKSQYSYMEFNQENSWNSIISHQLGIKQGTHNLSFLEKKACFFSYKKHSIETQGIDCSLQHNILTTQLSSNPESLLAKNDGSFITHFWNGDTKVSH